MLFCFEEPATAEVGYWLAPWARGRGLAVATIALTLRWGFEELGLTRIQGLTAPSNDASQRAMERAGMRREGRVEDYQHPQVGLQDVVVYAAP